MAFDLEGDAPAQGVVVAEDVDGDGLICGRPEELGLVDKVHVFRHPQQGRNPLDPFGVGVAAAKAFELGEDQRLVVRIAKALVQGVGVLMADAGGHGVDVAGSDVEQLPLKVGGDGFGALQGRAGRRGYLDEQPVGVVLGVEDEGHHRADESHDGGEGGEGDR